eukprot:1012563-Amphidinium_carterae.6
MERGKKVPAITAASEGIISETAGWRSKQAKEKDKGKDSGTDKGKGKDKSKDKRKDKGKGKKRGKVAAVVADEAWERQPWTEEWQGWADEGWSAHDWWQQQVQPSPPKQEATVNTAAVWQQEPEGGSQYDEKWVFTAGPAMECQEHEPWKMGSWLVDSGAAVHLISATSEDKQNEPVTVNSLLGRLRERSSTKVAHPILSVSALTDAGHSVRFEGAGASIRFSTGEARDLVRDQGIYHILGCFPAPLGLHAGKPAYVVIGHPSMVDYSGRGADIEQEADWAKSEDMAVEAEALCEDAPEAVVPKGIDSPPAGVRKKERDAHQLTHMPHRAWCDVCVMNRGRDNPHRRHADDDDDDENDKAKAAKVEIDFAQLLEDSGTGEHWALVATDAQTKMLGGWYVGARKITLRVST